MGAYATLSGDDPERCELEIRGIICDPSGRPFYSASKRGPATQAEELGRELAETLLGLGADRILERFATHGAD